MKSKRKYEDDLDGRLRAAQAVVEQRPQPETRKRFTNKDARARRKFSRTYSQV